MENAKKSFGINLRQAIKSRGLTFGKAAEMIGVSLSFVNQMMNGENAPSLDMLFQISDALKCPISELVGEAPASSGKADLLVRLYAVAPALDESKLRGIVLSAERLVHGSSTSSSLVSDKLNNKSK